jgi:hypothetical protein
VDKKNYSSIPSVVWLSMATAPFLTGLVALNSLSKTILEISQASEELFRGDRLPILRVPKSSQDTSDRGDD